MHSLKNSSIKDFNGDLFKGDFKVDLEKYANGLVLLYT